MSRSSTKPRNRQTKTNGDATAIDSNGDESQAVNAIQEAEALRQSLRDALAKTGRLVVALKRQRKQARLMQSTLASLRQLQAIGS